MKPRVPSSGVLLFRAERDSLELLLVHPGGPFWAKKDRGAWSIPKGAVEAGEGLRACALREIGEELGAPPPLSEEALIELGTVRQRSGKVVHGFAAEGQFDPAKLSSNTFRMEWPPHSGREGEFPEVDRAQWFDPPTAKEKLLAAQVPFIDRLLRLALQGSLVAPRPRS